MTTKEFFTGRALVIGVLIIFIILGLGIFVYQTAFPVAAPIEPSVPSKSEATIPTEPPVFTWKFTKSDSLNLDGLPQTEVYLEASYSGKVITTLIMTAPGGCNDLSKTEADSAPNSTIAQCYAAGYGDLFKVTKGEHSYVVLQKVFEEAMPEYNPPEQKYVVVAELPLSQ